MKKRQRIDELETALKQISDLTGSVNPPPCHCVQCQVHRIATKALKS